MDIVAFLKTYQSHAQPYYRSFFRSWQKKAEQVGELPAQILTKFADLYPRGKQIRGALAVLGYQLAGGRQKSQILKASICLELFHTAILILDDIFDDDDRRRGVPTIHKQWATWAKKHLPSKPNHQQLAINNFQTSKLSSDLAAITAFTGFHLAPYILNQTSFPDSLKLRAHQYFLKKAIFTGWGEALDISSPLLPFKQKQSSAAFIHTYKTIHYTTILPLTFGAILAGEKTTSPFTKSLQKYAYHLGSIFQIQDDIMGTFGDPAQTGKANTSDLTTARWTILIEFLFQQLKPKDKTYFSKIFSQPSLSPSQIAKVKQFLLSYNVVNSAQQLAQKHRHQGQKSISHLTKNKNHQTLLFDLLSFMLNRHK